jgi:nicotinamide riboside kinase
MSGAAFVIGILGAESSGKTQLALDLERRLRAAGVDALAVAEHLREFCDRHHRTPRRDEQAAIAAEQTQRIAQAAARHAVVVADTTALMTAIYSEIVFGDTSLYAGVEAAQRRCDLTLLMALDLPWQADGLQRDGAHVREPVDALVRATLARIGQPFVVVVGQREARLHAAWRAVRHAFTLPAEADAEEGGGDTSLTTWHTRCERCGDANCERHLLPRSLARD